MAAWVVARLHHRAKGQGSPLLLLLLLTPPAAKERRARAHQRRQPGSAPSSAVPRAAPRSRMSREPAAGTTAVACSLLRAGTRPGQPSPVLVCAPPSCVSPQNHVQWMVLFFQMSSIHPPLHGNTQGTSEHSSSQLHLGSGDPCALFWGQSWGRQHLECSSFLKGPRDFCLS